MASLAFFEAEAVRHQIEIIQGIASQLETEFNGFTTLLFGFVLVAYFAGQNLSQNQVIVLTVLYLATISQYILTSLLAGLGIVVSTAQLADLAGDSQNPVTDVVIVPARYYFSAVVQVCCVFASLYFMWSVRRPKAD